MTATAQECIDFIDAQGARQLDRARLIPRVINRMGFERILEIGVWKGEFSDHLLRSCDCIADYYMIDPWRHLEGWNKPLNVDDAQFTVEFEGAMARTAHSIEKRHVLRGTTTEVIDNIEDNFLDAVYIDGDHTLRGIMIDLITSYPKVRPGGVIFGDDFVKRMWQHGMKFEPTMVFPTAIYFAEAMRDTFIALPTGQFAIVKTDKDANYELRDPAGTLQATTVLSAVT